MGNKFYCKKEGKIGNELFNGKGPLHLRYDANNPNHIILDDTNPYFHPIPHGCYITLDENNVPNE